MGRGGVKVPNPAHSTHIPYALYQRHTWYRWYMRFVLSCSEEQHRVWKELAYIERCSLSEWVRRRLDEASIDRVAPKDGPLYFGPGGSPQGSLVEKEPILSSDPKDLKPVEADAVASKHKGEFYRAGVRFCEDDCWCKK